MSPASRKQCDVAGAQYVRLGPSDLNLDFAPLHEVDGAHVVALYPSRRRVRRDFRDVVPGEVNRAQKRRENIPGGYRIRTAGK
jgi:hypothetical protein